MKRFTIALACAALLVGACSEDDSTTAGGSGASTASSSSSGGASSTSAGGQGGGGSASSVGGTGGAGGNALPGTVPCAGNECAAGEVCCFDNINETQLGCAAPGGCGVAEIELSCNHPDDCPGGTCCSEFDGMVQTMRCQPSCAANNEYVMCSGPDQAACPAMTTCSNARAGMGYHYCRP